LEEERKKPSLGEVLAATGGVQDLQRRVDELRLNFRQNTGWTPGAFVSQFFRRWTERLDSVGTHMEWRQTPSYVEETPTRPPSMTDEDEVKMLEEELRRRKERLRRRERERISADISVTGIT